MKQKNIDLHVHPFLGRNSLKDVVEAMDERRLDVLGLESLDSSLYPYVVNEAKKICPQPIFDSSGVRLPTGKYLLNAREYNTKERFHIITIGYSLDTANKNTEIRKIIDKGLENNALIVLDHPFVDNVKTKTAGHISEEMEDSLEKLCKEYSGKITLEWNGYCIPWIRSVLKSGLNALGFDIRYSDVNKKAEELSEKLRAEGYNVPVVADTDLHARNRRQLKEMGKARITAYIEGECGRDIVNSIKEKIFNRDYENVKEYVSSAHLLKSFCIPILIPGYFKKPRA